MFSNKLTRHFLCQNSIPRCLTRLRYWYLTNDHNNCVTENGEILGISTTLLCWIDVTKYSARSWWKGSIYELILKSSEEFALTKFNLFFEKKSQLWMGAGSANNKRIQICFPSYSKCIILNLSYLFSLGQVMSGLWDAWNKHKICA